MHAVIRSALALSTLLATTAPHSEPNQAAAPSMREGAVVVELFTSQGCSSCPPAEALLGELARRDNLIALAFHVDYWDSLGWRDRFASAESTERQARYVAALGLPTAFTPQIVVDGRRSVVGSDRRRIEAELIERAETVALRAAVDDGDLIVTLPEAALNTRYDVNVMAYLPTAVTAIGRGENTGRTLTEFNIVRQQRRAAVWDGHATQLRVPLDSFPKNATRVAVLLQRIPQGAIVGSIVATLR